MFKLVITIFLLFNFQVTAKLISGEVKRSSFEDAKGSPSYLKFILKTTKVFLLKSDVDGYVKKFKYTFDYNEENNIIRNMKIVLQTVSMDTDNDDRNTKLHNLCMSYKEYPLVSVKIRGPVFLNESRERGYPGKVVIRGENKNVSVKLKHSIKNGSLMITGMSLWSLKEMDIPDPSILLAKLADEVQIDIKISTKL
jgi:hypothetical protein